MAKHFLDDAVKELLTEDELSQERNDGKPWYNVEGDCIQYVSCDRPYFGERVDEYLTVFRAIEDERPIGFIIKGVKALLNAIEADGAAVHATFVEEQLQEVGMFLLLATCSGPKNRERLEGYSIAIQTAPRGRFLLPA